MGAGNNAYLAVLRTAACSAAEPGEIAVCDKYDAAHMWTTVASQAMYLPADQGMSVAPSGRMHVKLCPALHNIFSYLWVENRIFNKFKLKNLICVNIVKCKVKFCLPEVLHRFLTNLGSTGGPHEISRRAACV